MQIIDQYCRGVAAGELAAGWVLCDQCADKEHLIQVAKTLWPRCEVYHGHTHIRLLLDGTSHGKSLYVDLEPVAYERAGSLLPGPGRDA
ncbi:MAG: hypothetical protein AB1705_13060 [Verrucomicrobiota bacterium]